ncbi:MAG: glycosyltransferase [Pirellulales bacterium]|nr:glycosyltransferase [Pirellulales bacterium]
MRILQILPSCDYSGAAKQAGLLAEGLPRSEFQVHGCVLGRIGAGPAPGPRDGTTVLGRRWGCDPRTIWQLKTLIEQYRPAVVHAWKPSANAYGCAALRLSRFRPAALVAGYRSVEPWRRGLPVRIERQVARRARCLAANSSGVRDYYTRCGLPGEKFRVIANGVAPPPPPSATRRQLLAELGLPDSCRLIGMVGRLTLQKRIKDAIWAADLIKVIRKDVHLLILGDGPHRGRLEKFRDQVQIVRRVHFLGWRGDAGRFLPHFDLLWSTSAYEGHSNPILEAMAAGVPVVAADIPGNRDLVLHEETGLLAPVGDRTVFAQSAHRLLEDPALSRRLAAAGRDRALREFSVEKMIGRYADLYRSLCV